MPPTGIKWFTGWGHGRRPQVADNTPVGGLVESVTGEDAAAVICDAAAARTGNYGLQLDITAAARRVDYQWIGSDSTVVVATCYFRFVSLPTGNPTVLYLSKNATASCYLMCVGSTRTFRIATGNSATYDIPDLEVKTGQWYRWDVRSNMALNHTIECSIALDDGPGMTQPTQTSTDAADNGRYLRCGDSAVSGGAVIQYADCVLSNVSADYPIGPVQVYTATIDQTAAAEHQSITTTEWQYTDDFSAFSNFAGNSETDSRSRLNGLDTTSGIRMNAAGAVAGNGRWKIARPDGLSRGREIYAVQLTVAARESAAGTNNATIRLLLNGNTTNLFSGDPGWGTTWNFVRDVLARPGGGAWTDADLDNLYLEVDSTDAAPEIWLAGVHLDVLTRGVADRYGVGSFPQVKPGRR